MKRCFVIMPYGGDDTSAKRQFEGVYQAIIAPAARAAGYEPKRSDIAGAPGNITHDIIRDLADSEVVIADLTTANANVFFELGIRHAFRKSGTVHIVDAAHSLPFDVRQYRAIEYSTDLAAIPELVTKIAEAIRVRETEPGRPDNPVHDAIPQLPFDIMATGDTAMQQQLKTLQQSLKDLRAQNETLHARLAVIDPEAGQAPQPEVDVDSLLDSADAIMKSTGSHAILRLRQAMNEGGAESFIKTLRQVLKSPYLDENDFAEIVVLCREAGLNEHRRATLEVARRRYPHSDSLFLSFLDSLDDSPGLQEQERGRVMIEQRLKIQYHGDKPRLSSASPLPRNLIESVGMLFNFYNRQQRYEWILSVWDSLPETIRNEPMLLRNRARALAESQRLDEAQDVFEQAMELEPTNDQTLLWYSSFLDDQGKYSEAYELSEKAILADPDDPRLFFHMAILIFNRGYVRVGTGQIEGPLPRNARAKVAVPFILRAVANGTGNTVEEAVRILVRGGAMAEAQAVANRETPKGKYETAALELLMKRLETPARQPEKAV